MSSLRALVLSLVSLSVCAVVCRAEDKPAEKPADTQPPAAAPAEQKGSVKPMVTMKTSLGDIKIELYPDKAPATVKNFLSYVDDKFYDGTIFHRVISGFMIQGGGFTPDMAQKPTKAPVKNEAQNGLKNDRGTLAMARTMVVDSATAQFFINVVDNDFLNFRSPDVRGFGYCVFGKVVEGMDVVDKIKAVPTGQKNGMGDVPNDPVKILEVRRAE
jgi:cyclophilin family peptidyl-prolyl cis-trans isomerase